LQHGNAQARLYTCAERRRGIDMLLWDVWVVRYIS
jgi:hypothetical protein